MNWNAIAKLLVDIGSKAITIGAPIVSNWKQNKLIKETVAKEVAEQIEEALKNR